MLNFNGESTAEEMLENFIKDQKHLTLLERIKAIRQNSYFMPDYNKPKVFTDINILYKEESSDEFKPINYNTITTCERPEDFGRDFKAWKKIVNRDHKRNTTSDAIMQREEAFQRMMRERYAKLQPFFNRMMRVE